MPKFRTHRKCVVSKSIVGKSLVRESMGPGLGIGLESSTGVGGIGRRPLKILLRRKMLRAKRRDCMDEACGRIHARVWRMRRTRSGRVQPRDLKKPTLTPAKLRDKSIASIFSGDLFPGTLGRKCPGKGHRRNSLQCAASSALGTKGAAGQPAKCWGWGFTCARCCRRLRYRWTRAHSATVFASMEHQQPGVRSILPDRSGRLVRLVPSNRTHQTHRRNLQ